MVDPGNINQFFNDNSDDESLDNDDNALLTEELLLGESEPESARPQRGPGNLGGSSALGGGGRLGGSSALGGGGRLGGGRLGGGLTSEFNLLDTFGGKDKLGKGQIKFTKLGKSGLKESTNFDDDDDVPIEKFSRLGIESEHQSKKASIFGGQKTLQETKLFEESKTTKQEINHPSSLGGLQSLGGVNSLGRGRGPTSLGGATSLRGATSTFGRGATRGGRGRSSPSKPYSSRDSDLGGVYNTGGIVSKQNSTSILDPAKHAAPKTLNVPTNTDQSSDDMKKFIIKQVELMDKLIKVVGGIGDKFREIPTISSYKGAGVFTSGAVEEIQTHLNTLIQQLDSIIDTNNKAYLIIPGEGITTNVTDEQVLDLIQGKHVSIVGSIKDLSSVLTETE